MKIENDVIEYGPGDISYLPKKGFKLQEPESPIIEMWTEEMEKLEKIESAVTKGTVRIIIVAAGLSVIDVINGCTINNSVISTVTDLLSMINMYYALWNFGNYCFKLSKRHKFKTALLYYHDLKEYEKRYSEEPSIINNPTLKGISRKKILKRVDKVQNSHK